MATIITHPQSREYDAGWERTFGPKMDENHLFRVLQEMGETHFEVATTILKKGISGKRQSPTRCPITRYAEAMGFTGVITGADSIDLFQSGSPAKVVLCPDPVRDFIKSFDRGEYPELIGE
jgi:hypothetical protein